MMTHGIVATTYDWRNPVTKESGRNKSNPYGKVYRGVIGELASRGWEVLEVFNQENLASRLGSEESQLELNWAFHALQRLDPNLVFHDPDSFYSQTWKVSEEANIFHEDAIKCKRVTELRKTVQKKLYLNCKGRVERVFSPGGNWDDETSSKDIFYNVATHLGVPVPKTVILPNANNFPIGTTYMGLSELLTGSPCGSIFLKAVQSSGGKDVYLIDSPKGFADFKTQAQDKKGNFVAQEAIPLPSNTPYSIRVVNWGGFVLGAALLINLENEYVSNAYQGGEVVLDLGLSQNDARVNLDWMKELSEPQLGSICAITDHCGIDFDRRLLPEEVSSYSQVIGDHPSNALLRGNDFMYDEKGTPLAIESNYHPGPPGTGMFSGISGLPKQDAKTEIKMAIESIVAAIESEQTN